jgi:hypothetical protein
MATNKVKKQIIVKNHHIFLSVKITLPNTDRADKKYT